MEVDAYLEKYLDLIKIEREEDLRQYQERMMNTSLQERKKEGVCWYPVVVTNEQIGVGEKYILTLEKTGDLEQKHHFQAGGIINFFTSVDDQRGINAVVKQVRDHKMKIVLNGDELPEWINDGKLGINLMFDDSTYQDMKSTIKNLQSTNNERLKHLINIIYNNTTTSFKNLPPTNNPSLNKTQLKAVNHCIASNDIAIIHGPPGTGKTTTISATIAEIVKAEKQVLVCAPSNTAVDVLVEKLTSSHIEVLRIGHPARVTDSVLRSTLDHQLTEHDHYSDLKMLRRKSEEMRKMALKYKRNFGKAEREQRRQLLKEVSSLRSEAIELEHFMIKSILNQAQVIACTLSGSNHKLLKSRHFKTVFIDEAGQALEGMCWTAMMKADRIILAGDQQQLPPTVKSFKAAQQGFANTVLERMIERPGVSTMLDTQYRMMEEISSFSSQYFYRGQLHAHASIAKRELKLSPVVEFIDTAGCGFDEKVNPKTLSTYNSEEANFLVSHMAKNIGEIGIEQIISKNLTIGVIAPYKAQIEVIRKTISEHPFYQELKDHIIISSVDGFQGQERDITYISFTRSNDKGEVGFLKEIRRTNVAITRAKRQLIMVGDSATLSTHPFYDKLIQHYQSSEAYKSAFEYIYME